MPTVASRGSILLVVVQRILVSVTSSIPGTSILRIEGGAKSSGSWSERRDAASLGRTREIGSGVMALRPRGRSVALIATDGTKTPMRPPPTTDRSSPRATGRLAAPTGRRRSSSSASRRGRPGSSPTSRRTGWRAGRSRCRSGAGRAGDRRHRRQALGRATLGGEVGGVLDDRADPLARDPIARAALDQVVVGVVERPARCKRSR